MNRRRLLALCFTAGALVSAALPQAALAHGVGVGREDLPIPKWLFGWGASVVLVASFVGLAVLWQRPRLEGAPERRRVSVPRVLDPICGAIGVAVFVLVVYAGYAGTQIEYNNIEPAFVFVAFWVVTAVLSVFFGDVFRAFNPWRAIARGVAGIAAKVSRGGLPEPLAYPTRLGRWPAAFMILAFVWVELAYIGNNDPSNLSTLAVAYAAVQFVGMSLYGIESWSRYGDGLGVYFGLYARISGLRWERGALFTRPLLSGLTKLDPVCGTVFLLCAMIGTTAFDGFSAGPTWNSIGPDLGKAIKDLGFGQTTALNLADTIGIIGAVGVVTGLYVLGVAGMRRDSHVDMTTTQLARHFAHSLVPIAAAYVIAHYFSLIAFRGQSLIYLVSDPLGQGHDYFGTANHPIDYKIVSNSTIWYVQVGALVIGHIAGLILAHDRALVTFKDPRTATRSQYWMLAVMIAFTSLGLWLLSQANA
ncbi:MAG: hypothetical protein QOG15_2979 [Solirubrobacteraceae bacterium]|jgi:hypothetical protein|nr:hypothetical protein [Solirubrobacteraceae bacterium]